MTMHRFTIWTALATLASATLIAAPAVAKPAAGAGGPPDPVVKWYVGTAQAANCQPADPAVSVDVGANVYYAPADPGYGKVLAFACTSVARGHGLQHAAPPPAVDPAINQSPVAFPITASQFDSLRNGSGGQMRTNLTIDAFGALNAMTNTHEMTALHGFQGLVHVLLADAANKVVWVSPARTFSVDGTMTGTPDRNDAWSERIPIATLVNVREIAIVHVARAGTNPFSGLSGGLLGGGIGQSLNQIQGMLGGTDEMGSAPVQQLRLK